MHRVIRTLLLGFLLVLTSVAFGEESGGFSLQEALRLAYEQNPRVVAARREAEAARGRWVQAGVYPNPELSLKASEISEGLGRGSTVGDDAIELSQELDLLGKVPGRAKIAAAEYEAAQRTLQRTWDEVAFEVTRTYNEQLLSTQGVGVAREVLGFTRRLLDQVQLKHDAGEALRNELLRARIEVAKAENSVLEAQKEASLNTAQLNILLGRKPEDPLLLTDELSYEPKALDPAQLLQQALDRRPDLKASGSLLEAQREKLNLALRDILENPTVSAIGTRERGEAGTEQVFGLAVRWPLPFWNRNQGAIQETKADLARQQMEREALSRQVELEVVRALAEVKLAQRQVNVWQQAVEQADELIRLATLQYGEGDIPFITYLEHLATVREIKLNYLQALAAYRNQTALLDQAVAATLVPSSSKETLP